MKSRNLKSKRGLSNYFSAPGKGMQYAVYNDAVKRFKFRCRYMAFVDGDEFIYPKTNQSIAETVDEVLSHDEHAAGLVINWQLFGSNGHETADYSRKVLERFTRRAPDENLIVSPADGTVQDVTEVDDDGILRYAVARAKTFQLPDKSRAAENFSRAQWKHF